MKPNLLIIAAVAAIAPHVADASLVVTTGSTLGSTCYNDTSATSNYDIVLFKCIGADSTYITNRKQCSSSFDSTSPNSSSCYVGTSGNTLYWCDDRSGVVSGTTQGCNFCPHRQESVLEYLSSGVVRITYKTYNYTDMAAYTCTETLVSTTYEYGCRANYWTEDAPGPNMNCESCPANATCTDKDGHTDTFKCNKGYFPVGDSCIQCPSSGGIAGTTASTGATSVTECYLPSGSTGTDTTGTFTLTGDCYW